MLPSTSCKFATSWYSIASQAIMLRLKFVENYNNKGMNFYFGTRKYVQTMIKDKGEGSISCCVVKIMARILYFA